MNYLPKSRTNSFERQIKVVYNFPELKINTVIDEDQRKQENISVLQHDSSCIKLQKMQTGAYYQFQNNFPYGKQYKLPFNILMNHNLGGDSYFKELNLDRYKCIYFYT